MKMYPWAVDEFYVLVAEKRMVSYWTDSSGAGMINRVEPHSLNLFNK